MARAFSIGGGGGGGNAALATDAQFTAGSTTLAPTVTQTKGAIAAEAPFQVLWDGPNDGDPTAATLDNPATNSGGSWNATENAYELGNSERLYWSSPLTDWSNCVFRGIYGTNEDTNGYFLGIYYGTSVAAVTGQGSMTDGHRLMVDHRGSSASWLIFYATGTSDAGVQESDSDVVSITTFNGCIQRDNNNNNRNEFFLPSEYDAEKYIKVVVVKEGNDICIYVGKTSETGIRLAIIIRLGTTGHNALPGPYFGVFSNIGGGRKNYVKAIAVGNADALDSNCHFLPNRMPSLPTTPGNYALKVEDSDVTLSASHTKVEDSDQMSWLANPEVIEVVNAQPSSVGSSGAMIFYATATSSLTNTKDTDASTDKTSAAAGDIFKSDGTNWVYVGGLS